MGNILIIGANNKACKESIKHLYASVKKYKLIGFIDDKLGLYTKVFQNYSVIGRLYQVPFLVKKYDVQKIIIIAEEVSYQEISELLEVGKLLKVKVKIVSEDLFFLSKKSNYFRNLLSIKSYTFTNALKRLFLFNKRFVDICLAFVGLLYFIPLFILYFLICGFSKNNFVYDRRVSQKGKLFSLIKFNITIKNESSPFEIKLKKLFSKYSLEYLPSFFNVLKGDLSFIGCRAYKIKEYKFIYDSDDFELAVKPGIANFWQILSDDNIEKKEILLFDNYYKENPSFIFEMRVLLGLLKNGYKYSKETIIEKSSLAHLSEH